MKPTPATPPRVCQECGADRRVVRESRRYIERNLTLRRDVEKLASENGLLSYRFNVQARDFDERMSRANRKIVRQARVIVRLEAKLREAGVRPYAGAQLGDTSTGAEYDAAEASA